MSRIITINESSHSISKLYKMVWHCRLADGFLWQNGELNHLSESGFIRKWVKELSDSCAVIKTVKSKAMAGGLSQPTYCPKLYCFSFGSHKDERDMTSTGPSQPIYFKSFYYKE